jgi:hypothetical protein
MPARATAGLSYSRNYSKSYSSECLTLAETLVRGIRPFDGPLEVGARAGTGRSNRRHHCGWCSGSYTRNYSSEWLVEAPARPAITGDLGRLPARLPAPHVDEKKGGSGSRAVSLRVLGSGRAGGLEDHWCRSVGGIKIMSGKRGEESKNRHGRGGECSGGEGAAVDRLGQGLSEAMGGRWLVSAGRLTRAARPGSRFDDGACVEVRVRSALYPCGSRRHGWAS